MQTYIHAHHAVHTYKHSHSLHLYMCVGRHILCSTEQCVHTYPVGISDSTPATSSCAAWVHISDTPHNWTWPPKNIAGCHNRQKEQLTTENHVCTQCSLSLFTTVTLEMPTHCTILLSQCQLCHRALGWSIRMSSEVFATWWCTDGGLLKSPLPLINAWYHKGVRQCKEINPTLMRCQDQILNKWMDWCHERLKGKTWDRRVQWWMEIHLFICSCPYTKANNFTWWCHGVNTHRLW